MNELPLNVFHAVDAVRASGATVPKSTIDLMILVDNGKITADEAIKIIIKEEGLTKKFKSGTQEK